MATSKKQKRLLNIVMVIAAAVVVLAGVMAVSALKSPTAAQSAADGGVGIVAEGKRGNVNVVRAGVGYSLDDGSVLVEGDLVETLSGSSITIAADGVGDAVLSEDTAVSITASDASTGAFAQISAGEVCVLAEESPSFVLETPLGDVAFAEGSVAVVSTRTAAVTVQVLAGSAEVAETTVLAGQMASLIEGEGESVSVETTSLVVKSLSDFAISQAQGAIQDGATLCFGTAELDALEAARAEERAAAQAAASGEASLAVDGGLSGSAPSAGSGGSGASDGGSSSGSAMTCTIEIRCDTILDNMGSLAAGKDAYVPANGVILATSTVRIGEGDTVFDVLQAACKATGIPLEYAYTPMYESYYIEGINNLYEFDCGSQSGWTYKVNGRFPNYGCSSYVLKDGDVIVWCYTCTGQGADVGAGI